MWSAYRMRVRRQYLLARTFRKGRELHPVSDRTMQICPSDLLLFCTLRNEKIRLPFFLDYYRQMGINHFLIVDNGSEDGSGEFLRAQPDVSLWSTAASYRRARFGVDWTNALQRKYAHGHWVLTVDPDEFFLYPFCDTRPLKGLTDWLDSCEIYSFSAMLLDMYPKGALEDQPYVAGQDPLEIACWFDSGNYTMRRNPDYGNLWIQGGVRGRMFFSDAPQNAPTLNKIPLVKWHRRYAYVDSSHMLLPRRLNSVYDRTGGEKASGILLHTKFLDTFSQKVSEECQRTEHHRGSIEYRAYAHGTRGGQGFWSPYSEKYIDWRQLEVLGLLSKGNWA